MVSILAIPALVFLFLKLFGKNHFEIPVYYAKDSVKVESGYKVTKAHNIPDFSFTNQNNRLFSSKELRGKTYVADFFFTKCPSICPKMTSELTRVQEAFEKKPEVKIVSFTVDPASDSAAALKRYAMEFRADTSKWNFLTGEKKELYTLAQKGFFVSALEDKNLPEFIHSDKLILVDKNGWIRGYYNGTDRNEVDRLIREIQVLLYSYDNESTGKE